MTCVPLKYRVHVCFSIEHAQLWSGARPGSSPSTEAPRVTGGCPPGCVQRIQRKQESQSNGACRGLHQRRLQADCSTCLQARQEVGDGSEPEFNWVIGKAGSLLDYKLVGVHTCISGSTSVCDSGAFERMKDSPAASAGDKDLAKDFLMVGEMPNCSSAAVYVLKSGEGFMIASNYEALDDDRGDLM